MMHLRDYHLGGERTAVLGEGDADYSRLSKVLDEIGFSGELVVELAIPPGAQSTRPPVDLLAQSRDQIRQTMGI